MKVTTEDPPPLPKYLPPHPGPVNLTQSDHDMIKSFLSSSTLVFPLSPGTALGELVSFAPPSPTMAHISSLAFSHAPPSPSISHLSSLSHAPPPSPIIPHLASLSHAPPSPSLSHLTSLAHAPSSPLTHPHLPNLSIPHDHHITPDIRLEPLVSHSQHNVPASVMDLSHGVFGKTIPDQLLISNIPQDHHWPETINKKTDIKNVIKVEKQPSNYEKEDQRVEQVSVPQKTEDFRGTDLVKRKISGDALDSRTRVKINKNKKRRRKMKKSLSELKAEGFDKATELEDCSEQVLKRLQSGCECDQKCFDGLKTDLVYRHRCNIAELSKPEHDMYLMGVVLTSLLDPSSTTKHKERQRHRNKYVFRGREVCQDAFLYLENITLYQLKSVRKHVTDHGVTPRIHKNKGKKPHNVFQLDHYQLAHRFVEDLLQARKKTLPKDLTCTKLHENYKEYFEKMELETEEQGTKMMAYSTFRNFVHERFPQLKFGGRESEGGTLGHNVWIHKVGSDLAAGCIDMPLVESSLGKSGSTVKLDMTSLK